MGCICMEEASRDDLVVLLDAYPDHIGFLDGDPGVESGLTMLISCVETNSRLQAWHCVVKTDAEVWQKGSGLKRSCDGNGIDMTSSPIPPIQSLVSII